jgi:hypothetical protein
MKRSLFRFMVSSFFLLKFLNQHDEGPNVNNKRRNEVKFIF